MDEPIQWDPSFSYQKDEDGLSGIGRGRVTVSLYERFPVVTFVVAPRGGSPVRRGNRVPEDVGDRGGFNEEPLCTGSGDRLTHLTRGCRTVVDPARGESRQGRGKEGGLCTRSTS